MKSHLLLLACIANSACVAVPKTVTHYDDCGAEYRKMELSFEQVRSSAPVPDQGLNCSDNCGPLLVALALVTPASVLLSGSVVLVGNTVYWAERPRQCAS